jgi:ABC-type lipoprotein export system ATPase subunit
MLLAQGLEKSFRAPSGERIPVLRHVELSVAAGELAVIAGASGSGKSTLLNVLGLLEEADAGVVSYAGRAVSVLSRSARSQARGQNVGFVFQSFLLLPSLTALENVLLAARYVGKGGAEARTRGEALLEEFGLAARRDHHPPQLSGGEQQRVAFCRAVFNDPPLLLADEPTGNLDDANGRVIFDALRRRAAGGSAVVVVSHRPDVFAGEGSVYRIEGGCLTRATHQEPI